MRQAWKTGGVVVAVVAGVLWISGGWMPFSMPDAVQVPAPGTGVSAVPAGTLDTVVFSGGCFWGVQAVFEHVKGVTRATAGYAGGAAGTAEYEVVSSGTTGHAESVQVIYDPAQVTFGQLLQVFFAVVHDPTQLNRQGPDWGTQYRSAIWTTRCTNIIPNTKTVHILPTWVETKTEEKGGQTEKEKDVRARLTAAVIIWSGNTRRQTSSTL